MQRQDQEIFNELLSAHFEQMRRKFSELSEMIFDTLEIDLSLIYLRGADSSWTAAKIRHVLIIEQIRFATTNADSAAVLGPGKSHIIEPRGPPPFWEY